jgi:copper(I)-binding protein
MRRLDIARHSPWFAVLLGGAAGALLTALVVTGGLEGAVEVREPAVGATTSPTAAVYLTMVNPGGSGDELVAASCECSRRATLHLSSIDDAGVASMAGIDGLEVAPGATVRLEPGGSHVMLEELNRTLEVGDDVVLELDFASGQRREVTVPVVELADLGARDEGALPLERG